MIDTLASPFMGRSKFNSFQWIKEKIWQHINNGKNKLLSQPGREILIKAVLQGLSMYTMSVYRFPQALCRDIGVLYPHFWWGWSDHEWKIHWFSWKSMRVSKMEAGMGFRNLKAFNLALLAKMLWYILSKPHSLAATILKDKYLKGYNIMEVRVKPISYWMWKSIIGARMVIERGDQWTVWNGATIKIWKDQQLPILSTFEVQTPMTLLDEDAMVTELFLDEQTC